MICLLLLTTHLATDSMGWPLLTEGDGEVSLGKRKEKAWAEVMLGSVSCMP